jgi:uncharacterized protein (DUF1697 family)
MTRLVASTTYVALLRGVNVGGKNIVAMSELRGLFDDRGYSNVRTFIQSGNVLFDSTREPAASLLESAILERCGVTTNVIIRSAVELRVVLDHNPFEVSESTALYVGFLGVPPDPKVLEGLDVERFVGERLVVIGAEFFLHLPRGAGNAKLPSYLARQLKVPFTIRNWNTLLRLIELTSNESSP